MEQEEICTIGKCWHHALVKVITVIHKYYYLQARSHWLGWSGVNLTTFIQLYNIDLANSATLKTALTIL